MARPVHARAILLLASATCVAAAVGVACGFPNVEFASDDGGPGGDSDPGVADGAGSEATADSALVEGSVRDDATAKVPDGSCLPDDCDCDRDFFFRGNCDAGIQTDARLDCDDFDPLRKPDATLTSTVPDQGQIPYGDWNCDAIVDKAYSTNLKCSAVLTSCTGGAGFKGNPGCGVSEAYFTCQDLGLFKGGCQAVLVDDRRQLCK